MSTSDASASTSPERGSASSASGAKRVGWLPSLVAAFSGGSSSSNSNSSSANFQGQGQGGRAASTRGAGGGGSSPATTTTQQRHEEMHNVPDAFRTRVDKTPYQEREFRERLRAQAPVVVSADRAVYDELALCLFRSLERGKRRRRVHSYDDCFWGKDAIDYLVATQITHDAPDARNALRILLRRRIIQRVDHTRPFFNDVLGRLAPAKARARAATLQFKHSITETEFRPECLYAFNPAAFATERIVVSVVGATALRYRRRTHLGAWVISAKFREQRIDAYATVSLGHEQIVETSIVHDGPDVRWDEDFSLLIPFDTHARGANDVWVRIYDFDEVLDDYEIGMVLIPLKQIRENCAKSPDGVWRFKQMLMPASTLDQRVEEAHGVVELEFQLKPYFAPDPDWTVFPQARETYEDRLARLYEQDDEFGGSALLDQSAIATLTDTARDVGVKAFAALSGGSAASSSSASSRHMGGAGGGGRGSVHHNVDEGDEGASGAGGNPRGSFGGSGGSASSPNAGPAPTLNLAPRSGSNHLMLSLSSVKLTNVIEMAADVKDKFVWVEFKVGSSAVAGNRARTKEVTWPTPDSMLGSAAVHRIPDAMVGSTARVRAVVYMRTLDFVKVRVGEGEVPLRRFYEALAPENPDAPPEPAPGEPRPLDKEVPIPLKRAAAFKRDLRKRVGTLLVRGCLARDMAPLVRMDGSASDSAEGDGASGPNDFEAIELDAVLLTLTDVYPKGEPFPAPLKNVVLDKAKINASIVRVTAIALNSKSQLTGALAKAMGSTDLVVGEWMMQGGAAASPTAAAAASTGVSSTGAPRSGTSGGGDDQAAADAAAGAGTGAGAAEEASTPTPSAAAPAASANRLLVRQESVRRVLAESVESDVGGSSAPLLSPVVAEDLAGTPAGAAAQAAVAAAVPGAVAATSASAATATSEAAPTDAASNKTLDPARAVRVVEFVKPASSLVKSTRVKETCTMKMWEINRGFAFEVVGQALDAPYGDTFQIAVLVSVEKTSDTDCAVTVSQETRFVKAKPFVSGAIESGALQGVKDTYTKWHKLLQVHSSRGSKRGRATEEAALELKEEAEHRHWRARLGAFAEKHKLVLVLLGVLLAVVGVAWFAGIRIVVQEDGVVGLRFPSRRRSAAQAEVTQESGSSVSPDSVSPGVETRYDEL